MRLNDAITELIYRYQTECSDTRLFVVMVYSVNYTITIEYDTIDDYLLHNQFPEVCNLRLIDLKVKPKRWWRKQEKLYATVDANVE